MKITKQELKQIIKEELKAILGDNKELEKDQQKVDEDKQK